MTQTDSSARIAPISQLLSYQLWEAQPHLLHISLFTWDAFPLLLPMAPRQTQFMEQEHCFPRLPEVACVKSDTSHVHLHSNKIRPGVENEGQREKIWERALQIRDRCFCLGLVPGSINQEEHVGVTSTCTTSGVERGLYIEPLKPARC